MKYILFACDDDNNPYFDMWEQHINTTNLTVMWNLCYYGACISDAFDNHVHISRVSIMLNTKGRMKDCFVLPSNKS